MYRVVCECFETMDCVTDAVECFHQMTAELEEDTNLYSEQLEWALGEWPPIHVGVMAS